MHTAAKQAQCKSSEGCNCSGAAAAKYQARVQAARDVTHFGSSGGGVGLSVKKLVKIVST